MINRLTELLEEKKISEDKLTRLMAKFEGMDNDNEDTWGGHDGQQALRMENEKYLLDTATREIRQELVKLGYKDKIR